MNLRIALVHYHLRRGGVTSVIMNQARALTKAGVDFLIITGEEPFEKIEYPVAVVEGLGYSPPGLQFWQAERDKKAAELAREMSRGT